MPFCAYNSNIFLLYRHYKYQFSPQKRKISKQLIVFLKISCNFAARFEF